MFLWIRLPLRGRSRVHLFLRVCLVRKSCVLPDLRRIGGTAAFRIGCRHPDSFAGVVSLGGPFPLDESAFARVEAVRRLPMLYCCRGSSAVSAAAHTDRTLRLFHAAGAMLAMRIYPGSGELSRAALGDVNRWLMDEICGTSAGLRAHAAG